MIEVRKIRDRQNSWAESLKAINSPVAVLMATRIVRQEREMVGLLNSIEDLRGIPLAEKDQSQEKIFNALENDYAGMATIYREIAALKLRDVTEVTDDSLLLVENIDRALGVVRNIENVSLLETIEKTVRLELGEKPKEIVGEKM